MLGFLLGVVFGGVQFFCPFAGLLLCAFTAKEDLLICAVTISFLLIVGAVVKFISARKGKKG